MHTFQYDDIVNKTLSPATRKAIAEQLLEDIDAYCIKEFTDEHRTHLGASVISHDCKAFAWYTFRWIKASAFDGRMLRLFNRGHLEEIRFVKWLRGIGCQVWEVNPNTNEQFRIYGVNGHYGGGLDSGGILPYLPDLPILMEFKTHNEKSFVHLQSKGLIISKHAHYKQMCSYGKEYQFRYGLYVAVNKNDDDLHIELVELDWNLSDSQVDKATEIINSQTRPARISENASYYECKWCPFKGPCHHNTSIDINCRSCKLANPVEGAEWYCSRYQQIIPKDFLIKGCDGHVSIND